MIRRLVRKSLVCLVFLALILATVRSCPSTRPRGRGWRGRPEVSRPARTRVAIDPSRTWVEDGDTIRIDWPDGSREVVRLLGIDAPEISHKSRPGVGDQPYGRESLGFARHHLLRAHRLEMVRAGRRDRYDRTLAYVYADGVNYSALAVENHMAEPTIDRYGDNGFPDEAAEVRRAAERAGPPPFESPAIFRERNFGAVGRGLSRGG
ncbi:Thermonuclease precursor [Aquisphaera giovannonii]|uniref:Thermonuclease n=1 Tax=Aquisphaera giovannonii TaxID=406548 RepID=A0A5B9W8L6_9BACT|nr:thermonuclease family protein [Aquisphaera giovannonii]QEH36958.1 Thermonuclease precursor [Aquisphaera giovannonii]